MPRNDKQTTISGKRKRVYCSCDEPWDKKHPSNIVISTSELSKTKYDCKCPTCDYWYWTHVKKSI